MDTLGFPGGLVGHMATLRKNSKAENFLAYFDWLDSSTRTPSNFHTPNISRRFAFPSRRHVAGISTLRPKSNKREMLIKIFYFVV